MSPRLPRMRNAVAPWSVSVSSSPALRREPCTEPRSPGGSRHCAPSCSSRTRGELTSLRREVAYAGSGTVRARASAHASLARIVRSASSRTRSTPRTRSGRKRPLVLEPPELALHGGATSVELAPPGRLARHERMQAVGLDPAQGGLTLARGAAPLARAALRIGPREDPLAVLARRRLVVAELDAGRLAKRDDWAAVARPAVGIRWLSDAEAQRPGHRFPRGLARPRASITSAPRKGVCPGRKCRHPPRRRRRHRPLGGGSRCAACARACETASSAQGC